MSSTSTARSSLFSATTKYGMQVALFLPALLACSDFRLEAELRWGPAASRAASISTRATAWSRTGKTPARMCRPS